MKTSIRTTWAIVRPFLRRRVWALIGVVVLGACSTVGPTAIIALFVPLWQLVLFPGQGQAAGADSTGHVLRAFEGIRDRFMDGAAVGADGLTEDARLTMLAVVVVVAFGLALFSAVSQYAFTMLSRWLALRVVVDLRTQLAGHLMGLSMRYHRERRFGDLLSRISADVEKVLGTVQNLLRDFVQKPMNILGALIGAAVVAPSLVLIVLVATPLLAVPVSILSRKIRKRSTKSLTTLGASVQTLTQMFQGVRTVKAYRAEERELEGFRRVNEKYLRHSMGMVRAIATTNAWTLLFSQGGLALLLAPVGWLAIKGGLSVAPGNLLTFFMLMARVYTNVKGFTNTYTKVQESVGAAARLQELLDEDVDVVEAEDPVPIAGLGSGIGTGSSASTTSTSEDPVPIAGLGSGIRLEHVGLAYATGDAPALADVDLEIAPGETIAVVGPSGAGKSTLADLLCRFIDPTDGRITVDGVDLRRISRDQWCSLCAHVDQVPFLFHTSIAENIRYGKPDATREEIEAAARAANIHEFIVGLPDGYDTDVADAGSRLSGGQRQRIVIARAVLRDAPLLILDEATSALDTESEAAVQEALDLLMRDRTVLVIAHRLSTIRNAHRIAVLEAGRLVELGTHDELLARGGTYARLCSLQQLSGVEEDPDLLRPRRPDPSRVLE